MTSPSPTPIPTTLPLKVHFQGGLAPLFNNATTHILNLPAHDPADPAQPATLGSLIRHLAATFLGADRVAASKRELFVLEGTVRPGILVLVNDADWELEGGEACVLRAGDEVIFVSTLHGG